MDPYNTPLSETQQPEHTSWAPEDTSQAINILSLTDAEFLDATYYGDKGYKDGRYLVPHGREGFYIKRQQYSSYTNMFRPAVDALVDPVFTAQINRAVYVGGSDTADDGSTLFYHFLSNCDGKGTSLHDFMHRAMSVAKRHETCFIIMDNFPPEQQPLTKIEAAQRRVYPYIFLRTVDDLEEYDLDRFGNPVRLVFRDLPETVYKKGKKPELEERYREYTAQYTRVLKKNNDEWEPVGDEMPNTIGRLPILQPLFSAPRTGKLCPTPELYSAARLCHRIYNLESELREAERSNIFSFLAINGTPAGGGISLSRSNALYYPIDHKPPQYVTQGVDDLRAYMEDIDRHYKIFYMTMEQLGVIVSEVKEESGAAKEWDFAAKENELRKVSSIAATTERAIADMFSLFSSEQYQYVVEYPSEFSPANAVRLAKMFDTFLLQNNTPEAIAYTMKRYFKAIHADDKSDEYKLAIESYDTMATDEIMSNVNE